MSGFPTHDLDRMSAWHRPVAVSTLDGPPTRCLGPECNGLIVGFASGTFHASCPKARYKGTAYDITPWLETEARIGRDAAIATADAVGTYGPYEVRFPARAYLAYRQTPSGPHTGPERVGDPILTPAPEETL